MTFDGLSHICLQITQIFSLRGDAALAAWRVPMGYVPAALFITFNREDNFFPARFHKRHVIMRQLTRDCKDAAQRNYLASQPPSAFMIVPFM